MDVYTGAKYDEYRFDNGAVLVAQKWKIEGNRYIPDRESVYLHLIGGPKPPKGQYGIHKWETHDRFNRFPDSETAIVEFLKSYPEVKDGGESWKSRIKTPGQEPEKRNRRDQESLKKGHLPEFNFLGFN